MREALSLSKAERDKVHFLRLHLDGSMRVADVATALGLSERQVYRLKATFLQDGEAGLIHGLCARPSNNGFPEGVRGKVLALYQSRFSDYGPTLFIEKLKEYYQIELDHETVRRWLLAAGLWKRARKGRRHRKKRPRRSEIGDMVQFDGSHHAWFEDRGEPCCLLQFIDDASSQSLFWFAPSENTKDALSLLWRYVETHGIMLSIYGDRSGVAGDRETSTVFSRAAERLGIHMIYAHSPQAKGRVERANRTHQDRLVKELREHGISDIASANRFLLEVYIAKHNALFADTKDLIDVHRPANDLDLANILCDEFDRYVYQDMTISVHGRRYQIRLGSGLLPIPRNRVTVRLWLDGSMHVFWKDQEVMVDPVLERVGKKTVPPKGPPDDHAWRKKPPIGKAKRT
jgi:hypothetical protein